MSLNSLLLATLGRVSQPQLQGGPAFWMVPVNMRGPVTLACETANHTSYLQVETGADVTPRQLHEQVKAKLSRREHWSGWQREPFTNVNGKHVSVWDKPPSVG